MLVRMASEAEFRVKIGGIPEDELRVAGFSGVEAVSEPFQFSLELVSTDSGIQFDQAVGEDGLLSIAGTDGSERYVHGTVSRFEERGQGQRFTTYYAELVPWIARLGLRARCQIHQKMTVEEIVTKVLEDAGLASDKFRFDLKAALPKREYCVQYRETDLAFVSRLLEEEGIFYYFEHDKEQHVLVLVDDVATTAPIAGTASVPYHVLSGQAAEEEHVYDFRMAQEMRTGAVRHRDFDFATPSKTLEANEQADVETDLEVYDYPGRYANPDNKGKDADEAKRLAKVRLEELRSVRIEGGGESVCRRLVPGYCFTLEGHPRPDDKLPKFNTEYLLLRLLHTGSQPQAREQDAGEGGFAYNNSFECVPTDAPYRPPRLTPAPRIRGLQTAIVVGPGGEEIYTDEHGRVKVQFHWDLEGKKDQDSSCWIRVSQGWAGPGWGAMFIPRIGQEVIVDFEEGDPDRPIVTGRVYHGTNKPPYPLPDDKTKSTVKSDSSPGGGGSNELRFEDKKGSEEVYIHAQKDENIVVENDKSENVGHDETISIGNDRTETVGHDEKITVGNDRTESVAANETLSVGQDRTRTVSKNEKVTVTLTRTHSVGVNEAINVGAAQEVTVGAARTLSVGAVQKTSIGANHSVDVGASETKKVAKDRSIKVGKNMTLDAGDQIVFKTGKASISMKKDGTIVISGKDITIKGSGKINVKASKNVVIKGKKILEN